MAKKKNEEESAVLSAMKAMECPGFNQSKLQVTTKEILDETANETNDLFNDLFGEITEMVSDKGLGTATMINGMLGLALRKLHIRYHVPNREALECLKKLNMFSTQERLTKVEYINLASHLLATYLNTSLIDTTDVDIVYNKTKSGPAFKTMAFRDRSGLDISSTATKMIENIVGSSLITPDWLIRLATTADELFKHQCKLTKVLPNPVNDPLAQEPVVRLCIDIEEYRIEDFANYLDDVYEAYKNAISPRISKYETKAVKIPLPGNQVYIRPEYCFRKEEIKLCFVQATGYDCFTIAETVEIFNEIKYLKISDYGVLWAYNKEELEETIDLILEK